MLVEESERRSILQLAIVFFPLVADSQNGHRLFVLNFEQRHIAFRPERDNDFADKRVGILGLATRERKLLEDRPRAINDIQRPLCGHEIVFGEETIQSFKIGFCFEGKADAEAHPLRFEASRIPRNESMTSSFDAY